MLKIFMVLIRLAFHVRAFLPSRQYTTTIGGLIHHRWSKRLGQEPIGSSSSVSCAWSDSDQFIEKQRRLSNTLKNDNSDRIETEAAHLHHQKQVFDGMASTFASGATISKDLIPAYQQIAKSVVVGTATGDDLRIMDVACGSGALWPFILEESVSIGLKVNVVGVDLSATMVAAAKSLGNEIASKVQLFTFQVVESDIKSFCDGQSQDTFHVAVVNACFGNFWDPFDVLSSLANVTSDTIVVSHPLGAEFVEKLHDQDSQTVPHLLPTTVLGWQSEIARRRIPLRVNQLTLTLNGEGS
jgi:SAM-dependent methyltransferase